MTARRWILACALFVAAPAAARRPPERVETLTVSARQAELRGRPAMSSAVMGLMRRGETVQVVRRSSDRRWVEVDIGAGELAWMDARTLHSGPLPPAPAPRRAPEPEPEPAPPPRRVVADAAPRVHARVDAPPPEEEMHRIEGSRDDRDRDDDRERAPRATPVARAAADDESPRARRAEVEVVRKIEPPLPPHGKNYFELHVRLGAAIPQHRVATNGISTSVLPAYEYSATNLAVGVQLGYSRAVGRFRFHLDGRYLIAALGAVRYADGTQLALRDQNIGGGMAIGGFFPAAGGIDLRLRVGAEAWLTQITPSAPPLAISSEVVLGMAAGIEFGMPALFRIAGRPFGFRVQGGAIAPATQLQAAGMSTGAKASTYGAYAGGSLLAGLLANPRHGQVSLEARYDYTMVLSRYSGVCGANAEALGTCRDMSVSDARDGFVSHVATLGIYYQY